MRPFYFGPATEPEGDPTAFLPEFLAVILSDKKRPLRDIPWLAGTNENEGATFYVDVVMENPKLLDPPANPRELEVFSSSSPPPPPPEMSPVISVSSVS